MSDPTEAAMRAAETIKKVVGVGLWAADNPAQMAAIIDRETGLPEHLKLLEAAIELLEVADLRGDTELPHPSNDDAMWTARMQEAWDNLRDLLSTHESAIARAEESHADSTG